MSPTPTTRRRAPIAGALALGAILCGALYLANDGKRRATTQEPQHQQVHIEGLEQDAVNPALDTADEREAQPDDSAHSAVTNEVRRAFEELQQDEPDYNSNAELEARLAAGRVLFGEQGPTSCRTVCDCPAGNACQPGSWQCTPGLPAAPCCERSDCPQGQACVTSDGDNGVCGAQP